jgi:hypothetical protein
MRSMGLPPTLHLSVAIFVLGALRAERPLCAPAVPAGPRAEPEGLAELAARLRTVDVIRLGTASPGGERTAFPRAGAPGVEFAPRLREGTHRLDGYLALARSRSGLQLWTLRHFDGGGHAPYLFEVRASDPEDVPAGAVLQFVDGLEVPATLPEVGTPSRWIGRVGNKVTELLIEAWIALPAHRVIYRPKERKLYPLIPASGVYDPAKAQKLMDGLRAELSRNRECLCVFRPSSASLQAVQRPRNSESPEVDLAAPV